MVGGPLDNQGELLELSHIMSSSGRFGRVTTNLSVFYKRRTICVFYKRGTICVLLKGRVKNI